MPTPRASFSDHSANKNSAPRQMPTPASTAQRKGGRRATMTVNTPKTPAPQSKLASSSTTSPMDFRTSNLESHLKRKRPDINVETLLKEVTETRAAWERMGSFETESSEDESSKNFNNYGFDPRPTPPQMGYHKPPVVQMTPPLASRPPTPTSQEPAGFSRHSMSGMTPHVQARAHHMSADGDTEMHDCDASSSDDDDGGYRSDGGNDDELYTVPTRRPMQGEALEFRNGESSTFGPMLSGSNSGSGLFTQYLPPSPTPAFNPGLMSGFAHGGTALLNGGGIAPMALPTPSVTINPAVLMMDTTGGHSAPSPTMLSMAAALFNNTQMQHQYPQYEPEVPKHVRFAIPGIGGEGLRKEGVN